MDRKFENVFDSAMRSVNGELVLRKEFSNYYGYYRLESDLTPMQRRDVLYYSIWLRYGLDRLLVDHFEVARYLFMSIVLFNENLIPALNHTLNAFLPEDFSELPLSSEITSKTVRHLDSYLIWREMGVDHILKTLEANLMIQRIDMATKRPFGEESVYQWFNLRNEDKYAIKPTL